MNKLELKNPANPVVTLSTENAYEYLKYVKDNPVICKSSGKTKEKISGTELQYSQLRSYLPFWANFGIIEFVYDCKVNYDVRITVLGKLFVENIKLLTTIEELKINNENTKAALSCLQNIETELNFVALCYFINPKNIKKTDRYYNTFVVALKFLHKFKELNKDLFPYVAHIIYENKSIDDIKIDVTDKFIFIVKGKAPAYVVSSRDLEPKDLVAYSYYENILHQAGVLDKKDGTIADDEKLAELIELTKENKQ